MTVPGNVDKTAQSNKLYLTQWQRETSFYMLYVIISFKFELAILNIWNINMNNLTLKVTGRMILPLA